MPPKKSAGAVISKKAPIINGISKTKTAKANAVEAPAKKSTMPQLTNGALPTILKAKRKAEEHEAEPTMNGSKRLKSESATPAPAPAKRIATEEPPVVTKKIATTKKPKVVKKKAVINHAPTKLLNVYVFGEGAQGELGLGSGKGCLEVKRPRLNPLLSSEAVGVVQVAVGGMHTAVLTHDNKILTWGVNDQGALGRDTTWEGGLKDMDESSDNDSDSSEVNVNPHESTPAEVDVSDVPDDTIFTQLAASDSATFALTDEGHVYGWGTFRGNDGIIGFSQTTLIQSIPALIPSLKKITQIACGANHVLALASNGAVFAWGSGQQNQLGRRIIERMKLNGLTPREFGLKKTMVTIGAGSYHSFAVDKTGKVFAWGLNSYGATGITKDIGEGDESDVHHPAIITSLEGKGTVICIEGGAHHSIAVTDRGECLVWGRLDGCQLGIAIDKIPAANVIRDSANNPRILTVPTIVPGINAIQASAGSDHCVAVAKDGKVFSWGFSATYQTGLGTDDDVEVATQIDNTAVRGKKIAWAGAGGQFSVVAGEAGVVVEEKLTNGVNGY